ncbi:hypothetical protein DNU06_09005 [Putridiphycobacter roseus]|uniref:Uncharacterized protein n=1 Tax=Putridiphycobacter roseus TaxID=2219161 RepID=A0A2W1NRX9_9FLAO|nr:hypothetical protein [Putridiphycobacter roseus]PZE17398.1 hypothetical protein DNU06_09005 [Putridiphycobacter roseus]
MKKYLVFLSLISFCLTANAQVVQKDAVFNMDTLSEDYVYSFHNEGWALVQSHGLKYLANFSNLNYILFFALECEDTTQPPKYLIEFSNNYRDGYWGGLDFTSSTSTNFEQVLFFIDSVSCVNPFQSVDKELVKTTKKLLQKGKVLTIEFYNTEYNIELGKDALSLNRSLSFSLANGHLLDVPTQCTP